RRHRAERANWRPPQGSPTSTTSTSPTPPVLDTLPEGDCPDQRRRSGGAASRVRAARTFRQRWARRLRAVWVPFRLRPLGPRPALEHQGDALVPGTDCDGQVGIVATGASGKFVACRAVPAVSSSAPGAGANAVVAGEASSGVLRRIPCVLGGMQGT